MNILFVHTSSFKNCGGIGRVTEINAKRFSQQGHKVYFFILKKGEQDHCFGFTQYFLPDNHYEHPDTLNNFRDTLSRLQIAIIINQSGVNIRSLQFIKKAVLPHTKIITCYHGAIKSIYDNYSIILRGNNSNRFLQKLLQYDVVCRIMRYNYKRKMKRDLQYVIDHSDKFVLLAENYIKELAFYNPRFDFSKVTFINNPVKYTNSTVRLEEKEKRLLFVGRINFSEKRCDLLPVLWEKVTRKFPDWTFDIVGSGPKLEALQQLFASKQLPRVRFHGYTDPLPFYQKALILTMTSAIEGYGLVLTEALENDVVPIAFDVSYGVKEALDYGALGVLIPPFDLTLYTEELEKLMVAEANRAPFLQKAHSFNAEEKNKAIEGKWLRTFSELHSQ